MIIGTGKNVSFHLQNYIINDVACRNLVFNLCPYCLTDFSLVHKVVPHGCVFSMLLFAIQNLGFQSLVFKCMEIKEGLRSMVS